MLQSRRWLSTLLRELRQAYEPVPGAPRDVSTAPLAAHYRLDASQLPFAALPQIRELHADDETQAFLASCRPNWCTSVLAQMLRSFFSVTDTNGLLGRGQMFVLSASQFRGLLAEPLAEAREAGVSHLRLLDVGAGDGEVTSLAAPLFDSVTATEVSWAMARRLRSRGYAVVEAPALTPANFPEPGTFDVVSLLNLLDRCDHAADVLRGAIRLARPGTGRILVAVVLPFCEFVEEGAVRRAPRGPLPLRGARCGDAASFEASLSALITRVFWPLGLYVEALSRVPYLCRGDLKRPYYVLSDAILLLRPTVPYPDDGPGLDLSEGHAAVIRANLCVGGPLTPVDPLPVPRPVVGWGGGESASLPLRLLVESDVVADAARVAADFAARTPAASAAVRSGLRGATP